MDANGLRFWSVTEETDWSLPSTGELRYDRERRTLKLSSFRDLDFEEPSEDPEDLLGIVPQAVDGFDTYAYLDSERVFAAGAVPGNQLIASFLFRPVNDLLLGFDGVLYLVVSGGLSLLDPRQRWPETPVLEPDLVAFRLAAQVAGGVLILDRQNKRLWLSEGQPFPSIGFRQFDGDVFRPDEENPDPPRVRPLIALANDEDPVALATNSRGETVLLSWLSGASGRSACIRRVELDGRLGSRVVLVGVQRPFSIGWLDGSTVAILVRTVVPDSDGATRIEVVPYAFPDAGETAPLQPLGGVYPLVNYSGGPFAHVMREPVRYPAQAAASLFPDLPRHLVRLSAPELARAGEARNGKRLDSGRVGTIWHRAYLEAVLPPQCGVRLSLAASETAATPANDAFFPHVFGDLAAPAGVPRGIWSSQPSELPFNLGLVPCPLEAHRAGLFSVLVQRAGRRVTKLVGRYLHVRVELVGNARSTPELAALRVYGSRFSYVDQYLPRLYQEQLFPPDADAVAQPTTPADFLERFLGTFESFLTPLEDRIANAHLLTDPESAPEGALDWLGQWIGFVFDPAYPPEQRRRALKSAMELHRWHGTLRGLTLALNILTDDGLERGEIVVVEDYRLRRTFATILGADLADENDPLTAGIVDSGNSIVGDTLILGNELQREFLSVFRDQLPERPPGVSVDQWATFLLQRSDDRAIIDDFFDRFANRLTVLVQREVSEDRVRLIQRILELEAPAHILSQVVRASQPFIVGLASLVGVDTFLRSPEPLPPTRIDDSRVGTTFLLRAASLDPRLEVGS